MLGLLLWHRSWPSIHLCRCMHTFKCAKISMVALPMHWIALLLHAVRLRLSIYHCLSVCSFVCYWILWLLYLTPGLLAQSLLSAAAWNELKWWRWFTVMWFHSRVYCLEANRVTNYKFDTQFLILSTYEVRSKSLLLLDLFLISSWHLTLITRIEIFWKIF